MRARVTLKTLPEIESLFAHWRQHFERVLGDSLPSTETPPKTLHQAMHYSALSGGKRIRPLLVYASGHALELDLEKLDSMASAVELIHAYSLIHDDLPAMDDDDLRRGRPTCHLAFDEATAILAGDALQALSFQVLTDDWQDNLDIIAPLVSGLAKACGSAGMAGGQMLDLQAVGQAMDINQLEQIHALKTGELIRMSAVAPAWIAKSEPFIFNSLQAYGECVGLGFQIHDDILDVTGDTTSLGKQALADQARNKPTFPSLIGLDASIARAKALYEQAMASLERLPGDTRPLQWLAEYMISRDR